MLIRPVENLNIKLNLEGTRRLISGYPWVLRKSLTRFKMPPPPGTAVRFQDASGNFLGHGFSDTGAIPYRLLSRERRPVFNALWFEQRVEQALNKRRVLLQENKQGALRVLHGEADGLPGLNAEWYKGWLVTEALSAGAAAGFLSEVEEALREQLRPLGLLRRVRFEGAAKGKTALALETIAGSLSGEDLFFSEGQSRVRVDLLKGKDLRHRQSVVLAAATASGQGVLLNSLPEAPRYAVACLQAGAIFVTLASMDTELIENCKEALALNALAPEKLHILKADSLEVPIRLAAKDLSFGLWVQGISSRHQGRGGVFNAARNTPQLAAAVLQRVQAGGRALFVGAECGFSREGLAAAIKEGAVLGGSDSELKILGNVDADFPALDHFPEGSDFYFTMVQVHQPGSNKIKGRNPVTKKSLKTKKKKNSKKRSRHA